MPKKVLVAALLFLLVGSTVIAFAWWDRRSLDGDDGFEIGIGVRLELKEVLRPSSKALVPVGSLHARDTENYTTAQSVVYTFSLEQSLALPVALRTTVTGLHLDGVPVPDPSALRIHIGGSDLDSILHESETRELFIENALRESTDSVDISITFSFADDPGPAPEEAYALLAGKTLGFTVRFELE